MSRIATQTITTASEALKLNCSTTASTTPQPTCCSSLSTPPNSALPCTDLPKHPLNIQALSHHLSSLLREHQEAGFVSGVLFKATTEGPEMQDPATKERLRQLSEREPEVAVVNAGLGKAGGTVDGCDMAVRELRRKIAGKEGRVILSAPLLEAWGKVRKLHGNKQHKQIFRSLVLLVETIFSTPYTTFWSDMARENNLIVYRNRIHRLRRGIRAREEHETFMYPLEASEALDQEGAIAESEFGAAVTHYGFRRRLGRYEELGLAEEEVTRESLFDVLRQRGEEVIDSHFDSLKVGSVSRGSDGETLASTAGTDSPATESTPTTDSEPSVAERKATFMSEFTNPASNLAQKMAESLLEDAARSYLTRTSLVAYREEGKGGGLGRVLRGLRRRC